MDIGAQMAQGSNWHVTLCPVCLDELPENHQTMYLPCIHAYHERCWAYLSRGPRRPPCAICRDRAMQLSMKWREKDAETIASLQKRVAELEVENSRISKAWTRQ